MGKVYNLLHLSGFFFFPWLGRQDVYVTRSSGRPNRRTDYKIKIKAQCIIKSYLGVALVMNTVRFPRGGGVVLQWLAGKMATSVAVQPVHYSSYNWIHCARGSHCW